MKKLISGILSATIFATSMLGFAPAAQAAPAVIKDVKISAGQCIKFLEESGNTYKVALYNNKGNNVYEPVKQIAFDNYIATSNTGIVGYINKTDVDTYSYGRAWTNPYDSIVYGAKYIADNYYDHQYTLYFQKFNAEYSTSNVQFTHEYMTNIKGAKQESEILYNGYKNAGLCESSHKFYIPVYTNIPGEEATDFVETNKFNGFTGKYGKEIMKFSSSHLGGAGGAWQFIPVETKLTFEEAVAKEKKANPSASEADIRYYLNPLNFLNEKDIYQFEDLRNSECESMYVGNAEQRKNLVESILKGSWMENKDITYYTPDGYSRAYTKTIGTSTSNVKYSDAIIDASPTTSITTKGWGVNYIAAKLVQENKASSGPAISGTIVPFKGIYNFFNVGSTGVKASTSDGLAFAAGYMKARINTVLYNTNATVKQKQTTTKPVAKPTVKNYTPAKVKLTSLTALKGHKIKAKWNKCSTSATGYQIYWAKDKKFKKVVAKTTTRGRSKVTYTGKNFTKGRKYYVRIRAYKKAGGKTYYGPWSNIKAKTSK